MRLLIYQPTHTGHHLAYLGRMLPGVLELPVQVVLATTPEAVASDEFRLSLASFEAKLEVLTCCTTPPRGVLANARHRTKQLLQAIERVKPDHVAAAYIDGIWQILAMRSLLGRRPWPKSLPVEGWIYRVGFADPQASGMAEFLSRRLFLSLLKRGLFDVLHLSHEILYEFARDAGPFPTRVVLTPDPVILFPPLAKEEARRRLQLPEGGTVISLSGMIDKRKGALLLLEAFEKHARAAEDESRLLLAGPHSEEVQAALLQPAARELCEAGRVISSNRYLNEEDLFVVSAASDLVTAPYPNHPGRSSIILWAAAAGRPSLGINRGCIGHVIEKHHLGWTCDARNTDVLAAALRDALAQPWTQQDAERVREYAQSHSVDEYQRISSTYLRERLQAGVENVS